MRTSRRSMQKKKKPPSVKMKKVVWNNGPVSTARAFHGNSNVTRRFVQTAFCWFMSFVSAVKCTCSLQCLGWIKWAWSGLGLSTFQRGHGGRKWNKKSAREVQPQHHTGCYRLPVPSPHPTAGLVSLSDSPAPTKTPTAFRAMELLNGSQSNMFGRFPTLSACWAVGFHGDICEDCLSV